MKLLGPSMLRFIGAVFCIVIAVVSWVIMAEKLQGLFTKYPQCYFMVYWVHCWYSTMYVAWKAWREFPGGCHCNSVGDGAISWKRALWTSASLGVIALLAAYFWYLSLSRTSVPANTAIYQSAIAFTFIFSVPILREKVSVVKVVAVMSSIGGVALVAVYSERDKSGPVHQTVLGYVYLVISTVLFALLEVLYKKFATIKNDPASACNGLRFVGLMGVHTMAWMWPPLIILHFTHIETFTWPTPDVLVLLFVNAVLDVLFNASIFVCIALSSPLFASVGTVTAIPVSIVVDFFIHRTSAYFVVYIGMGLIAIGFTGFTISEFIQIRKESKEEQDEDDTVSKEGSDDNESLSHVKNVYSVNDTDSETVSLLSSTSSLRKEKWKQFVLKYVV